MYKINPMRMLGLVAVVLTGCGGDPLVGSWVSTVLPGYPYTASQVTSYSDVITFSADKKITKVDVLKYNATAPSVPRFSGANCTFTTTYTGTYTTTTSGSTSTVTPAYATGAEGLADCTSAGDDLASNTAIPEANLTGILPFFNVAATYKVSGNTLTLTTAATSTSPEATITYTKK